MSDKTRRKLCSRKMWMSIASFASMIATGKFKAYEDAAHINTSKQSAGTGEIWSVGRTG